MKRYTIMSMGQTVGGVNHIYEAQRTNGNQLNGNYTCEIDGRRHTKIITDFLGMPNTFINSIRALNGNGFGARGYGEVFTVGETTEQGRIREIRINNQRAEALIGNAIVNFTPIETLTKVIARTPVAANNLIKKNDFVTSSRSNTKNPFEEIEEKILQNRDIRFEKLLKKNIPSNLTDFLIKFFTTYNVEKNTIYVDDKEVQTQLGKRRSLGDIFKLCKYYFPNCTLREVLVLLYNTLPTKITSGFRTSYCNTIKKRVWYYNDTQRNGVYGEATLDEFGNNIKWYTSKL